MFFFSTLQISHGIHKVLNLKHSFWLNIGGTCWTLDLVFTVRHHFSLTAQQKGLAVVSTLVPALSISLVTTPVRFRHSLGSGGILITTLVVDLLLGRFIDQLKISPILNLAHLLLPRLKIIGQLGLVYHLQQILLLLGNNLSPLFHSHVPASLRILTAPSVVEL